MRKQGGRAHGHSSGTVPLPPCQPRQPTALRPLGTGTPPTWGLGHASPLSMSKDQTDRHFQTGRGEIAGLPRNPSESPARASKSVLRTEYRAN